MSKLYACAIRAAHDVRVAKEKGGSDFDDVDAAKIIAKRTGLAEIEKALDVLVRECEDGCFKEMIPSTIFACLEDDIKPILKLLGAKVKL